MEHQFNLNELTQAKENLVKLLLARGYNSPDNKKPLESIQDSITADGGYIVSFNYELEHPKLNKIAMIVFNAQDKARKETLKELVDVAQALQKSKNKEVNLIMIVSQTEQLALQPKAIAILNSQLKSDGVYVEIWKLNDLQFAPTDSNLTGQHILLSPEETTEFFEKNNKIMNKNQLPRIYSTDAMARFLGARVGEVIRVIRNSETTGLFSVYRIVI